MQIRQEKGCYTLYKENEAIGTAVVDGTTILRLEVVPRWRGRGYGSYLLKELLRQNGGLDPKQATCFTAPLPRDAAGRALAQKYGFAPDGSQLVRRRVPDLSAVQLCHAFLTARLAPGGLYVDATCGNGHDTQFLCTLAGPAGRVLGLDIQQQAVDNTNARLAAAGYGAVGRAVLHDHARLAELVQPGTADCVLFNFGWLPGAEHDVHSTADGSVPALRAALEALRPGGLFAEGPDSQMRQTTLVANHHMLFGKKKASSSGAVKPPTGEELLEHYTPEQLRAHFLALGLDQKSVGFSPKPFDPDPAKRDDPRYADPVLKEGALLTNVFNRLARSCFYEAQKNFDGCMPLGAVTPEVRRRAFEALLDYEERMHKVELHRVMSVCDEFIRWSNKWWADGIKAAEASEDADARRQVLVDSFYLLRVACLLMHPVVPVGCEKICDYLSFDFGDFFSWNYDFDSNDELCPAIEIDAGAHRIHELPPRFDFFRKHESQYK